MVVHHSPEQGSLLWLTTSMNGGSIGVVVGDINYRGVICVLLWAFMIAGVICVVVYEIIDQRGDANYCWRQ